MKLSVKKIIFQNLLTIKMLKLQALKWYTTCYNFPVFDPQKKVIFLLKINCSLFTVGVQFFFKWGCFIQVNLESKNVIFIGVK